MQKEHGFLDTETLQSSGMLGCAIIKQATAWTPLREKSIGLLCCLLEVSCPIVSLIVLRSSDFAPKMNSNTK